MQDQPDVYPRLFKMQQQLGGGGKYKPPKQSKKEKKKQKEDEERQRELYELQRQQIKQAEADAARANEEAKRANRAVENQNLYQSTVARADPKIASYISPFDPKANYGDKRAVGNLLSSAWSRYGDAQKKEAAAAATVEKKEKAAAAAQKKQTEEIIKAQIVAPLPTSYSLDAEEASRSVRRKEKRRIGLGAGTVFAGETGGYDTSRKTLLG